MKYCMLVLFCASVLHLSCDQSTSTPLEHTYFRKFKSIETSIQILGYEQMFDLNAIRTLSQNKKLNPYFTRILMNNGEFNLRIVKNDHGESILVDDFDTPYEFELKEIKESASEPGLDIYVIIIKCSFPPPDYPKTVNSQFELYFENNGFGNE